MKAWSELYAEAVVALREMVGEAAIQGVVRPDTISRGLAALVAVDTQQSLDDVARSAGRRPRLTVVPSVTE